MKTTIALAVMMGCFASPSWADTILLKTGKKVEGRVVAFQEQKFQVESDKGGRSLYVQNELAQIEFKSEGEEHGVPAELAHRTKGALKGNVLTFADSTFRLRDAQGKVEELPSVLVTSATFSGGSAKEIETITRGARVDLAKKLVSGKVTLVDFYADWCGPCRMISPHLEKVAKDDPDVVLRKVDIVTWGTEVCKQYEITSVPQVWVYDKHGKLVGKVTGASSSRVDELIAKAKQ